MKQLKTILFLDIDGVFSIPNVSDTNERRERIPIGDGHHIVCWPIPMYQQFLYTIGNEKRFHPAWLSAWGDAAHALTNRAMTQAFPVAYPLSSRQLRYAWQRFPQEGRERIDKKLIAAVYYLRARRFNRVIWVEDGFTDETMQWAERSGNVRLIDTTDEDIKRMLLSSHEQAVQEFMEFLH
jgi:hypothetical protein